jgi:uncharacterized protein
MQKKIKILHEVKNLLVQSYKDEIKNVILFGSRAWGKPSKYSDYDLLIIIDKPDYDWQFAHKLRQLIYDIDLKYNIITDNHFISVTELKNSPRSFEPFINRALTNGIYA